VEGKTPIIATYLFDLSIIYFIFFVSSRTSCNFDVLKLKELLF
jgi:hypothetical protein